MPGDSEEGLLQCCPVCGQHLVSVDVNHMCCTRVDRCAQSFLSFFLRVFIRPIWERRVSREREPFARASHITQSNDEAENNGMCWSDPDDARLGGKPCEAKITLEMPRNAIRSTVQCALHFENAGNSGI